MIRYLFPGEHEFCVPPHVTHVSVLCIGNELYPGGRGSLIFMDSIPVSPNQVIRCVVGKHASFGDYVTSKDMIATHGGCGTLYGTGVVFENDNIWDGMYGPVGVYGGRGGPSHGAIEIIWHETYMEKITRGYY